MDPLIWSVLFCIVMVLLIIIELLTPSFGLFIMLCLCALGASVYYGFQSSQAVGYVMVAVNLALLPAAILLGIQLIKRSPLMLHDEIRANLPAETPLAKAVHELVGKEGTALTTLRPAGAAQFGEQRIDVVTDGKYVEAGTAVKVLKVEGSIIVVEPV